MCFTDYIITWKISISTYNLPNDRNETVIPSRLFVAHKMSSKCLK